MKNKKIFAAVILLAAVALVFSSCAFKLSTEQELIYNNFITTIENQAKLGEVSVENIKLFLNPANILAGAQNFQIEDKTPDQPIKKGTTEDDLKKRFVPKKK